MWKNLYVGDIVHLSCDEVIPADLLLLASSDSSGLCHIETSNLDGENNLKQRQCAVVSKTQVNFIYCFNPTSAYIVFTLKESINLKILGFMDIHNNIS